MSQRLPSPGEKVIVHCNGFQCLGRYDSDNKWRGTFSDQLLPGVTGWSRLNDGTVILLTQTQEDDVPAPGYPSAPSAGPIRINLLAQAQEEAEARRRDPVKRAIWMAGFCLYVVLSWMLKLGMDIHFAQSDYSTIAKRSAEIDARDGATANELAKAAEIDRKLAALDRLSTNRFVWAPLLIALETTRVDDIRITRVAGDQRYTREDPRIHDSGPNQKVLPDATVERFSLHIEARDTSDKKQAWEKYTESLNGCNYFVTKFKGRGAFILDGYLAPPMGYGSDPSRQFVAFVLVSHFPEVRHGE